MEDAEGSRSHAISSERIRTRGPGDFRSCRGLHHQGLAGRFRRKVDVLIIGCGPAGLTLAAQLSAFPDIKTCIVDQKSGRLVRGQADGVACRTMEMFEAFGFSERVLKEAYWVNETAFWRPDERAARERRSAVAGFGIPRMGFPSSRMSS